MLVRMPPGDRCFHFGFFAVANEIKHSNSLEVSCFRTQIRLMIQSVVYLKPQYSVKVIDFLKL